MSRWLQAGLVVGLVGAGAALAPPPATAAGAAEVVIDVTTTADVVDPDDGETSLREAVTAASAVGDGSTVRIVLQPLRYELTRCDGTRDAEDDANADGDLDYSGSSQLLVGVTDLSSFPTIVQTCGAVSGERVLDATGPLALAAVVVTGGDAAGDGGGIRASTLGSYQLVVEGNRASGDGGGIAVSGLASLGDTSVRDNVAGRDGGGLAAGSVDVADDDGTSVRENTAGRDGGGIHATGTVTWGIDGGISDNTAGRDGGGVAADTFVIGSDGDWDMGPALRGNLAGGTGGGARVEHADVRAVSVTGNGAAGDGGGLWVGDDLSLVGTHLDGNVSLSAGAGVHVSGEASVDRVSIVDSAALGAGAGAWFGGDTTVDRLFVGGSQGQSAVEFVAAAQVDTLVVEGTTGGPAVWLGSAPTHLRGAQIAGNEFEGLVVNGAHAGEGVAPGPGGGEVLGGPHLLELSTLADNGGVELWSNDADLRVSGVALVDDSGDVCDVDRPLPGPDPLDVPVGSIGVQPSYSTSATCDLRAPGSTVGGPVPGFLPAGDTQGYVPTWDSPLRGAVQLPAGVEVWDSRYVDGIGWRGRLARPVGPGADIGAREAGEPLVHPTAPRRVLDTRLSHPLGPGDVVEVDLGEAAATGAVLNLTLVAPTAATHLTAWPAGTPRPTASTVNAPAGVTIAAASWVRTTDGRVAIRNNAGSAHVLVDVVGWIDDGSTTDPGSGGKAVTTVEPERVVDTRSTTPVGAGETRVVDLGGGPVPDGADAAIVNLTGVGATEATHLTLWRAGSERPGVSTLNVGAGGTVANLALVALDADGKVALRNAAGEVDVLVDVVAYLDEVADDPAATDSGVHQVSPARVFDSRAAGAGGPLVGGVVRTVDVVRPAGPLPGHASAAVVTLTLVAPSASAHLTAWASGDPRPATSNLNAPAGVTRATTAVVPLDADGEADLRLSSGTAHVVVDVVGYLD